MAGYDLSPINYDKLNVTPGQIRDFLRTLPAETIIDVAHKQDCLLAQYLAMQGNEKVLVTNYDCCVNDERLILPEWFNEFLYPLLRGDTEYSVKNLRHILDDFIGTTEWTFEQSTYESGS